MKFYTPGLLLLQLASPFVCGFGLAPRRASTRPALQSAGDCTPSLQSPCLHFASRATKLFSAAALSADSDGARNGNTAENFNVKYGPAIKFGKLKVNLFGAVIGLWEFLLVLFFWYPAVTLYGFVTWMSSKLPGDVLKKIDPYKRIPACIGYTWGLLAYTLFGLWPAVEGRENLEVLREEDGKGKSGKLKPAMYVGNHCSWMDIPFVARVFHFVNYKFIAKAELGKVPLLGKCIMSSGHVALDRTNRRSQMAAYKAGVQWLKDGVNLVTFAEGTRSRDGRLGSFKGGAFKMAQAVGAPIVPMSIHHSDKVQPLDYAFPAKSSSTRPKAIIKIGKPISTKGKSDDELLEEVWTAIADNLPENQKPTKGTPMSVK